MSVRMMPPMGPQMGPAPMGGPAPVPQVPMVGGMPPAPGMPQAPVSPQQQAQAASKQGLGSQYGGSSQGRANFKQFMSAKKSSVAAPQVPQQRVAPMLPTPVPQQLGGQGVMQQRPRQAGPQMGVPQQRGGVPQQQQRVPMGGLGRPVRGSQGGLQSAPMQFADGGMVETRDGAEVPRETVIAGQPHYLAYINPEEGALLKGLGGAGKPGPGGVPSYWFWGGGDDDDKDEPSTPSDNDGGGGILSSIGNAIKDTFSEIVSGGDAVTDTYNGGSSGSGGGRDLDADLGTGAINSGGTYSGDDDVVSGGFDFDGGDDNANNNNNVVVQQPAEKYYDAFGNEYSSQAEATAADDAFVSTPLSDFDYSGIPGFDPSGVDYSNFLAKFESDVDDLEAGGKISFATDYDQDGISDFIDADPNDASNTNIMDSLVRRYDLNVGGTDLQLDASEYQRLLDMGVPLDSLDQGTVINTREDGSGSNLLQFSETDDKGFTTTKTYDYGTGETTSNTVAPSMTLGDFTFDLGDVGFRDAISLDAGETAYESFDEFGNPVYGTTRTDDKGFSYYELFDPRTGNVTETRTSPMATYGDQVVELGDIAYKDRFSVDEGESLMTGVDDDGNPLLITTRLDSDTGVTYRESFDPLSGDLVDYEILPEVTFGEGDSAFTRQLADKRYLESLDRPYGTTFTDNADGTVTATYEDNKGFTITQVLDPTTGNVIRESQAPTATYKDLAGNEITVDLGDKRYADDFTIPEGYDLSQTYDEFGNELLRVTNVDEMGYTYNAYFNPLTGEAYATEDAPTATFGSGDDAFEVELYDVRFLDKLGNMEGADYKLSTDAFGDEVVVANWTSGPEDYVTEFNPETGQIIDNITETVGTGATVNEIRNRDTGEREFSVDLPDYAETLSGYIAGNDDVNFLTKGQAEDISLLQAQNADQDMIDEVRQDYIVTNAVNGLYQNDSDQKQITSVNLADATVTEVDGTVRNMDAKELAVALEQDDLMNRGLSPNFDRIDAIASGEDIFDFGDVDYFDVGTGDLLSDMDLEELLMGQLVLPEGTPLTLDNTQLAAEDRTYFDVNTGQLYDIDDFTAAVRREEGTAGADGYDTLFNYQNREGGRFSDIKPTEMTVGELLEFQKKRGEGSYGEYVQSINPEGDLATPVGAYQIVGTTMQGLVDAGVLDLDETFDKEAQDRAGRYLIMGRGFGTESLDDFEKNLNLEFAGYNPGEVAGGVNLFDDAGDFAPAGTEDVLGSGITGEEGRLVQAAAEAAAGTDSFLNPDGGAVDDIIARTIIGMPSDDQGQTVTGANGQEIELGVIAGTTEVVDPETGRVTIVAQTDPLTGEVLDAGESTMFEDIMETLIGSAIPFGDVFIDWAKQQEQNQQEQMYQILMSGRGQDVYDIDGNFLGVAEYSEDGEIINYVGAAGDGYIYGPGGDLVSLTDATQEMVDDQGTSNDVNDLVDQFADDTGGDEGLSPEQEEAINRIRVTLNRQIRQRDQSTTPVKPTLPGEGVELFRPKFNQGGVVSSNLSNAVRNFAQAIG